ncbi:MAG: glycosyltransferase [Chromatiales bacterium]|nr:glycosyltransferase [Chromatiales bacterium]
MAEIAYLLGHLSRRSGGVLPLATSLAAHSRHGVQLFGLDDGDTDLVLPEDTRAFRTLGPDRFGFAPGLFSAVQEAGPALVHNFQLWMYSSWLCQRWGQRNRSPYIVSPNGMLDAWALARSPWRKRLALHLYEARHLAGTACFHALTQAELRSIRALGLRNPVAVIPSGVEPAMDEPGPPPWSGQIPAGAPVLLYLGRLHPKKGLNELISAWRQVNAGDWHLVVAGWGPARYVRRLKQRLAPVPNASLHGPWFGSQKANALAGAEALVLPSFSEGMPQTVLEAWSHGLPVLMTRECNLNEGFDRGAAMPLDLAGQMRGLAAFLQIGEAQRREMGRAGKALVAERFHWPTVAAAIDGLYDWVLSGGPPPDFVSTD